MIPTNKYSAINAAILTVSDTRTIENDRSGQTIKQLLEKSSHTVIEYKIVKDDFQEIVTILEDWCNLPDIQAIIVTGGTGFTARDITYEAVTSIFEKEMTGFGELFRMLSYEEIGTRSMFSRATAGSKNRTPIYALPGSTNAVKLGTEKLILPSVSHFIEELHRH